MRKRLFFVFLLSLFFCFSTKSSLAADWSYSFSPNGLKAGDVQSITITGDLPATMYIILEGATSTENCPPETQTGNFILEKQGCVSKVVTPSSDSFTFEGENLNGTTELSRLKAGRYNLKVCEFDANSPSCTVMEAHKFSDIVVNTEENKPPRDSNPGAGQDDPCTIPNDEFDEDVCLGRTRLPGTCAPNFYCKLDDNACALGKGTCQQCPEGDEICYNGKGPVPSNSPLSLPCPTGGASYDSSKGCTRIKTAFGWVSTGTNSFTRWMLGFVLSIAGGIVTVVAIIAGYKIMTSQGDPDKVKNAREQLTAAIVGLIFIIFSLAILELITRDILGLPGFGG